jgi:hypothetical protein
LTSLDVGVEPVQIGHRAVVAELVDALEHFPPWRNRKGIPLPGQIMIHVEGW